jgi:poly-gamma-glutamate synthesis protein (capsule biosynthesis protein)
MSMLLLAVLAQNPRLTLVFGGDVIPHESVKAAARQNSRTAEVDGTRVRLGHGGWDHVFGPLTGVFGTADVSVVNLETPITTAESPEHGEKVFNASPDLLAGLKRAGVDVVTFANNHCLDQQREGIVSTRVEATKAQLRSVGAAASEAQAWEPLLIEREGFRIGLIAFTRWLNGHSNALDAMQPHVPVVTYPSDAIAGSHSVEQLLHAVAATAKQVDVLVVAVHWGDEYQTAPRAEDRTLAAALINAGATLVIGHHPHVLQPVELVTRANGSKGLVAFSLGNLISNQDADDPDGTTRDGLLLAVTLERRAEGLAIVRLTPSAVFTENRFVGQRRNVQAVLLDDELAAMENRIIELNARTDPSSRTEKHTLLERRALAVARRARILALMPSIARSP